MECKGLVFVTISNCYDKAKMFLLYLDELAKNTFQLIGITSEHPTFHRSFVYLMECKG